MSSDAITVMVGLGNMGECFEKTRHNAGFDIMDLLASRTGASFGTVSENIPALIASNATGSLIFVKPTTGMNSSGLAVRAVIEHYRCQLERVLVVYDDVSMPLGRQRFQFNGGSGGHHGIESIIAECGGRKDFNKLKVAVGPDPGGAVRFQFVLSRISAEIEPHYQRVLEAAAEAALFFAENGLAKAMNVFNGKVVA